MNNYNHFFIIGAQRSATTFLKNQLNKAPEIKMNLNLNGEPKVFLKKNFLYKKYLNNFFPNISSKITHLGEKSTSYYESPECILRIKKTFPNAKIVCILRNPSARAISNYYFSKKKGYEKRNICNAFENSPNNKYKTSVSPYDYIKRGQYYNYLKKWKKVFKENLIILQTEKVLSNYKEINKVFTALKIKYKIKKKYNSNRKLKDYNDNKHKNLIKKLNTVFQKSNSNLKKNFNISLGCWR